MLIPRFSETEERADNIGSASRYRQGKGFTPDQTIATGGSFFQAPARRGASARPSARVTVKAAAQRTYAVGDVGRIADQTYRTQFNRRFWGAIEGTSHQGIGVVDQSLRPVAWVSTPSPGTI